MFQIVVSCMGSNQSEFMDSFMAFHLWIGRGYIFESCG